MSAALTLVWNIGPYVFYPAAAALRGAVVTEVDGRIHGMFSARS